jgi:hypothetical protein
MVTTFDRSIIVELTDSCFMVIVGMDLMVGSSILKVNYHHLHT